MRSNDSGENEKCIKLERVRAPFIYDRTMISKFNYDPYNVKLSK